MFVPTLSTAIQACNRLGVISNESVKSHTTRLGAWLLIMNKAKYRVAWLASLPVLTVADVSAETVDDILIHPDTPGGIVFERMAVRAPD